MSGSMMDEINAALGRLRETEKVLIVNSAVGPLFEHALKDFPGVEVVTSPYAPMDKAYVINKDLWEK